MYKNMHKAYIKIIIENGWKYVLSRQWPPFLPPQKAIKWGKQFQVGKWGGDPPKSPLKNRPEMAK